MFRKMVIFFVVLVHVNGSMLLPQVAEVDIYNSQGQQADDINTVLEYVNEIILGHHKNEPVDDDNDQGQNFHLVKIIDYYFEPDGFPIKCKPVVAGSKNKFSPFPEEKINSVALEILAPPPRV